MYITYIYLYLFIFIFFIKMYYVCCLTIKWYLFGLILFLCIHQCWCGFLQEFTVICGYFSPPKNLCGSQIYGLVICLLWNWELFFYYCFDGCVIDKPLIQYHNGWNSYGKVDENWSFIAMSKFRWPSLPYGCRTGRGLPFHKHQLNTQVQSIQVK